MKKYITLFGLIVISQLAYSQKSVNDIFKEFSKMENVTTVTMGKFMMTFASLFTDTMGVDGIEVYAFDNCPEHVRDKLAKAVGKLKDNKYELMVNANENGDRTKVLIKIEEDMIRELVVVTTGSDSALVRIKGKIKPSDIERVVNKHSKSEC